MRARLLTGAATAAAVLAAAGPASAAAATLAPLRPGAPATVGAPGPLRDRVLTARSARARAAASSTRTYVTPDGLPMEVSLSSSFADTPENRAGAQSFVDFLASRLHGPELIRLKLFIGTAAEVNAACGGVAGVLACYIPPERRIYVPATDPSAGRGAFTREYVVTHEYGHHIAAFRRNDPFPSLDFGPKYWSSYERVCAGVDAGRFFPGDQGARYYDDPGEGFADAYAHLHYPAAPWQYNPALAPDAGAFAAIRRDVLSPWTGPTVRTLRLSLKGRRRATTTVGRFSLDGVLSLRLDSPRGASFDVQVLDGGKVVAQTRGRGRIKRLAGTVCRDRSDVGSFRLRVRRRSGSGRFALRVSTPG